MTTDNTPDLIVVNFAHPLTARQRAHIAALTGTAHIQVLDVPVQLDPQQPLPAQVAALVDRAGVSSAAWQSGGVLVNLPGYAPAATILLAELHGRSGHFPAILLLRAVLDTVPQQFEIADLLALQTVRDQARPKRFNSPPEGTE